MLCEHDPTLSEMEETSISIKRDQCNSRCKRLYYTRRVSYVEKELFILPEHLSSLPFCNGVRVARSLLFSVMF